MVEKVAVIAKITTQKKNTERFNIFLENGKGGEEYGFSVDQNVLIKFQLKKGQEIDELAIEELQFADDVKKATNVALNYLSHRMRSKKEIISHLKKKEVEDPIIPEVLHKLEEYRYVDDREFAIAYVRTQINTTLKGPDIIRRELNEKGIEQSIITDSLKKYTQDLQIKAAQKILEKTANRSQKISDFEKMQKIDQALLRKGFNWDVISIVKEEMESEEDSDEQWEALVYQADKAHRKYQKFDGTAYKQKMKQALYRKGFSIEQIERYLELNQEDL